jgi:UDP-N-acetylglucosamine 4,6-dehydratase
MSIANRTIMLIGGTGSLGQAMTTAALKANAKAIRVFSRNEYLQWQMRQTYTDKRIRWMIGDVRDRNRLSACMTGCDYVVHAAALKHVETGEYNPQEVIATNVLGSVNVVDCARAAGVKKVLGISSDKAVSPSCLYGSTKQIMETLFMDANRWAAPMTRFSILRSGNFIESHGNVFEKWNAQAILHHEIELTSEAMRRFFISTIDVAALAIQLLESMQGQEVFVPKMQEQLMLDLCRERHPDCGIVITGKGKGEKDSECLFAVGEQPQDFGDYWVVK